MSKGDIIRFSILAIFASFVFYQILEIKDNMVKLKIKSGESIILDNSSYKCKLTNTLEQK